MFILLLHTALTIEANVANTAIELDRISCLSSMEIASYNVMLDCCMRLHEWVGEDPEPTAKEIIPMVIEWEADVEKYLSLWGCQLVLDGIRVEPLENQTLDSVQSGFLGMNGSERAFISAVLIVSLESDDLSLIREYQIGIAA